MWSRVDGWSKTGNVSSSDSYVIAISGFEIVNLADEISRILVDLATANDTRKIGKVAPLDYKQWQKNNKYD